MVKIEYVSSFDDGNKIMSVKVIEASDTMIEFQIEYKEPLAVSRDPQAPDNLIIYFDD